MHHQTAYFSNVCKILFVLKLALLIVTVDVIIFDKENNNCNHWHSSMIKIIALYVIFSLQKYKSNKVIFLSNKWNLVRLQCHFRVLFFRTAVILFSKAIDINFYQILRIWFQSINFLFQITIFLRIFSDSCVHFL